MKDDVIFEDVRLVLEDQVTEPSSLHVQGGRIVSMGEEYSGDGTRIDGGGALLSPGFIDLHCDAIEKEIRPRPGGSFPTKVALVELDKKLAGCGITSMYHCLCFGESESNELRHARVASRVVRDMQQTQSMLTVRNKVHARFEVTDLPSVEILEALIADKAIDLLSFMDHTPGQGQFTVLEHFTSYYGQSEHLTPEQAEKLAQTRLAERDSVGNEHLYSLARLCAEHGIPLASHDDDTVEKVSFNESLGMCISEFPVRLAAAQRAKELGQGVLMGAPNVLRGKSLTGNLSGREAIEAGACNMLGSDYAPMSLLHAVFHVCSTGIRDFAGAMQLITSAPAKAMGLEQELGSLTPGHLADLVLIEDIHPGVPRVLGSWVEGNQVFSAPKVL